MLKGGYMKKKFLIFIKHFIISILIIIVLGLFLLYKIKPLFFSSALSEFTEKEITGIDEYNLKNDGPYVFYNEYKQEANYIKEKNGKYFVETIKTLNDKEKLPVYYYPDSSCFNISLRKNFKKPKAKFKKSDKIIVISDIEGKFRTFRQFLIKNKVMDKNYNWIFGKGQLVLLGDFVDKDFFETQVLWLIHRLEKQSQSNGGKVHYLLGNHEINNLWGFTKDSSKKYLLVADMLKKQRYEFFGKKSYMGRWLRSKNVIIKIDKYLFVHGGMNPEFLKYNHSLKKYNDIIRKSFDLKGMKLKYKNNLEKNLLSYKNSPFWYRGYANEKVTQNEIDELCNKFKVKKIIIGHTPNKHVKTYYNKKVIDIDVLHPEDENSRAYFKTSEGILIEDKEVYMINMHGEKTKL